MKLVADWKQAWRWSSMHAMGAALVIQGAWVSIPVDMQQFIHPIVAHAMTGLLLLLGIVGRIRAQAPNPAAPDETDKAGA